MKSFENAWDIIQAQLVAETKIKNWTVYSDYLGDEFTVSSVNPMGVQIEAPNAKNTQKVSKDDFEVVYVDWRKYISEEVKRGELREKSRFTKYTISIIKYFEKDFL